MGGKQVRGVRGREGEGERGPREVRGGMGREGEGKKEAREGEGMSTDARNEEEGTNLGWVFEVK